MSENDLNKVIHMITKLEIPIEVCDIFERDSSFLDFSINKKDSVSATEVIFATYMKMAEHNPNPLYDVAIKFWLSLDELTDDQIEAISKEKNYVELADDILEKVDRANFLKGLTYESQVYRYITDNIIKPNLSPNFVPLLAFGKCSLNQIQLSLFEKTGYNSQIIDFIKPVVVLPGVDLKLNIMVTGTLRGKIVSLHSLLNDDSTSNVLTTHNRAAILFQCLHALFLLDKFKIMHYDLHMNNILVQKLDDPICLSYNIFGNQISFKTKYVPKFFDWDRGYVEVLGDNPVINEFISLQIRQKFIPKRDFYQFVCSLKNFPKFFNLLKQVLPNPDYDDWEYADGTPEDEGNTFKPLRISDRTRQKINDFVAQNENTQYIFSKDDGMYVELNKALMENIFSRDEINRFTSHDKYIYSDSFVFFYADDGEVYINSGWYCQGLFNPSDEILYPLETLFSNSDLFFNATMFLNLCDDPDSDHIYSFPPMSVKKSLAVRPHRTMARSRSPPRYRTLLPSSETRKTTRRR